MGIPNRLRAARLNRSDLRDPVQKYLNDEDDGPDPDPDLDYSGVVDNDADEEAARERREKMKKSVGGDGGPDLDFSGMKGGREEAPEIPFDYSGVLRDAEVKEREADAAAIGEAVAAALDRRGVGSDPDEDDEVRKDATDAPEEFAELEEMVEEYVEEYGTGET